MIWSLALAAVGIIGIWLAGRKSHWGWFIGMAAQVLWFVYALATEQYGFILTAGAYFIIYGRNWQKWLHEKSGASTPEPSGSVSLAGGRTAASSPRR